MNEDILQAIEARFKGTKENVEDKLRGFLISNDVNYWDYVQVDTLLTLQRPRTSYKDEEIFIMYHQVTELVLKMMLHELQQLVETSFDTLIWQNKIERLNRYVQMLITSFDVMKYGMNYHDYNEFRLALAPASGFQSVQFRFIELHCTRLLNLVPEQDRSSSGDLPIRALVEKLYWKQAGKRPDSNGRTPTMEQFEQRYAKSLVEKAKDLQGRTLEDVVISQSISNTLRIALRKFDTLYNIAWPLVHLQTAEYYLDAEGEYKEATGGSEWKRYLHPAYQRRIFFPSLWSSEEKAAWGKNMETNI